MTKNKDFSKDLLRTVEDDGEYFTVKSTGRSGMSQTGLARFVGKHRTSIREWITKVRNAKPEDNQLPKPLKPFAGKPLTLRGYTDPQGRDIVEDTFCYALVRYFAWYAQDAETNTQAKIAEELIGYFGMRSFIHLKTGWYSQCSSEQFQQLLESHEQRVAARNVLKNKIRLELMNVVGEWRKANCSNLLIHPDTHNELNKVIQGLTSKEIKQQNGLPKNALIRDFYDTQPLFDYGGVSRVATTLIRCGMHPLEAVKLAGALFLSPEHTPEAIPLVENIHKVTKLLESSKQERNLIESVNFSSPKLPLDKPSSAA